MIIIVLFSCSNNDNKNTLHSQIVVQIDLEEVGVDCNSFYENDSIRYEPYEVHFVFNVINHSDSAIFFVNNNRKYSIDSLPNGIFTLRIDNNSFELYSNYEPFKIKSKSSVTVLAEIDNADFFREVPVNNFEEYIYSFVTNSNIEFNQRKNLQENLGKIKSEVVIPNKLNMIFSSDGKIIKSLSQTQTK